MAEETYAIIVAPLAALEKLEPIINAYHGDPLTGPAMLGQLTAAGNAETGPVTHRYLGRPTDEAWRTAMQSPTPPEPAGGWPLMDIDGVTELVSEAEAAIAWAARTVFTRTGEDISTIAAETRAAMFAAMSLAVYSPEI